jgi:hypothetical protein
MRRNLAILVLLGPACTAGPDNNLSRLNPDIIVAPSEVDFGGVVVLYDAEQVVQVSNAGRAPLNVTDIYVDGDTDGVYTITPSSIDALPADESIGVGISFEPATYLPYNFELVFESDDPDSPEYRVPLYGEGIDGPIPDIRLEPASLDFGTVAQGTQANDLFYIDNTGDGDLIIDPLVQSGSGNFVVTGITASSVTVPPGSTYPIAVSYSPTTDSGDNGTIEITSNDPDEGVIELVLLGNGGGDYEYPQAIIDCPATVAPPDRLQLNGSDSFDPNGTELTYAWTLDEAPEDTTSIIDNDNASVANLFVNLAGDWEVSLRVTNELDLVSAPAICSFEAIPDDQIQVELTWNSGDSDFDLHLIQGNEPMFLAPGDCCYCNPNPDWGDDSASSDNPDLSLDNRVGYGPEVTTLEQPQDGDYYTKVHYFADRGGGTTIATVRVYINGEKKHEASKTMTHNQVWDIGYVRWTSSTQAFIEQDNELYLSKERTCYYE